MYTTLPILTCKTCTDARTPGSRSRRSRSAALLTVDSRQILFDAGPDILSQLEHIGIHRVDAVFLTHAHSDAVGGFFDLDDILRKQKYPATLYVEEGTWRRLQRTIRPTKIWLSVKPIEVGMPVKVWGVQITPFRVEHSAQPGFPTLGYRIGNNLVYASDVKAVSKESEEYISGVDHAVLDGCFWFNTHFPTHLTGDETIALANRLSVHNLYLTQISHNYPAYPEAASAIAEYCAKQKITTKVMLTYDGMTISLD